MQKLIDEYSFVKLAFVYLFKENKQNKKNIGIGIFYYCILLPIIAYWLQLAPHWLTSLNTGLQR